MDFDWKSLVKTIAPTIGTVISGGNPLVGAGISYLSNALLGKSDGTEEEIAEVLKSGNPEILAKVKEADNNFKVVMKKLDVDITKLDYDDADSARKRQIELKDITPSVLVYMLIMIFSMTLSTLMWVTVPMANASLIYTMIGSLGTMTVTGVAYFHGSSRGSARKDISMLDKIMKK